MPVPKAVGNSENKCENIVLGTASNTSRTLNENTQIEIKFSIVMTHSYLMVVVVNANLPKLFEDM
jgi:hypothetical protein